MKSCEFSLNNVYDWTWLSIFITTELLTIFKLFGVLKISWIWVLSPFWGIICVLIGGVVIAFGAAQILDVRIHKGD